MRLRDVACNSRTKRNATNSSGAGRFCYFLSSKSRLKKAMIERTDRGLPRSVIARLSKFYVLSCESSFFSENKILALHCTFFIVLILYQREGGGNCHLPLFDIR